jgi:hypothetical protein
MVICNFNQFLQGCWPGVGVDAADGTHHLCRPSALCSLQAELVLALSLLQMEVGFIA